MSAIATITAYDGQATPIAHTFLATGVSREGNTVTASYKEAATGVPDYAQGRVTLKHQKLGSGVNRVSQRTELPVMESVAGQNASGYTAAPKVAYVDSVEIAGFFHERSIVTGRRSVRQLSLNIGANVTTSVAPATTGPTPELFDLLVDPT